MLDCANGAASALAPELFTRLGANVTTINNTPDGRNINLGCGSLHTEALQAEVGRCNADLGVAFDGDADRALFVDANGRLIDGDASLWVLARHLRSHGQLRHDTVVATVMSNLGLEIAFKSEGIRLVRTDVGDKYVLEELLRLGASLGGEQSGHIIFPQLSLAGDGMITTLGILRDKEAGRPLRIDRGISDLSADTCKREGQGEAALHRRRLNPDAALALETGLARAAGCSCAIPAPSRWRE